FSFSTDATLDGADKQSKTTFKVAALASGAAQTGTASVAVPSNLPPGNYYLIACADSAGVVQESNEGNNCGVSAATILVVK
ncbi:MAG TPA: CARDB domain-containing protein, partial [Candidatus Deferrimicrobiaceae bacterium]